MTSAMKLAVKDLPHRETRSIHVEPTDYIITGSIAHTSLSRPFTFNGPFCSVSTAVIRLIGMMVPHVQLVHVLSVGFCPRYHYVATSILLIISTFHHHLRHSWGNYLHKHDNRGDPLGSPVVT